MAAPDRMPDYYPPPEIPQPPGRPVQPMGTEGGESPLPEPEPMSPEKRMLIIGSVLVLLISGAFLVRSLVFTIRNLNVVGLQNLTWQQVATSAGLTSSSNYFGLNEERIKDGINANRYLIYERMQRVFPNTLVLYVRDRRPVASIHYIGVAYIMADDGMILEKTRDLQMDLRIPTISGLALRDIRQGSVPVSTKFGQLEICVDLTGELTTQGFSEQIADINLSEPTSIYMTTRDGYSVHLGDGTQLRAKLGTVRAVVQELRRRQLQGGVIEATVPGEATYRPGSV